MMFVLHGRKASFSMLLFGLDSVAPLHLDHRKKQLVMLYVEYLVIQVS